jgi:hypothetical protein
MLPAILPDGCWMVSHGWPLCGCQQSTQWAGCCWTIPAGLSASCMMSSSAQAVSIRGLPGPSSGRSQIVRWPGSLGCIPVHRAVSRWISSGRSGTWGCPTLRERGLRVSFDAGGWGKAADMPSVELVYPAACIGLMLRVCTGAPESLAFPRVSLTARYHLPFGPSHSHHCSRCPLHLPLLPSSIAAGYWPKLRPSLGLLHILTDLCHSQ